MSYVESAKSEVLDFIERSTRFQTGEVIFSDEESFIARFSVKVTHQGAFVMREGWHAGKPTVGRNDLIASSRGEFNTSIRFLAEDAERYTGIVHALNSEISALPYGTYPNRRSYQDFPRTAFFTRACHTCEGDGTVSCSSCRGSGEESCACCSGTDCMWCNGWGSVDCSSCRGRGTEECDTCNGDGEVTENSTPVFVVTPIYELEKSTHEEFDVVYALSSFSMLPSIEDGLAELQRRIFKPVEDGHRVLEYAEFMCPFFRVNVKVNGITSRVVVFGKRPAISDSGALLEKIVSPDLNNLKNVLSGVRWYDLEMIWHSQFLAKQVMESEIHRDSVELSLNAGETSPDFNAISAKLSKALTVGYIMELHEAMSDVIIWTAKSNRLISRMVTYAVALPVSAYFYSEGKYVWSAVVLACLIFAGRWIADWVSVYHLQRMYVMT